MLFDNAWDIVAAAGNTPLLAYTKRPVYNGALCCVSANDVKLGRILGEKIINVLVHKSAIKDTPIGIDDNPKVFVNIDAAKRLNVRIPIDMLNEVEVVE